jgi:hypothetical protein
MWLVIIGHMPAPNVVHLRPQGRPELLAPEAPRVINDFASALLRCPPRPVGLAACVAYLQEGAARLPDQKMAMRALGNLKSGLFVASGREAEMNLLWREGLATACFARIVATCVRFDAPLLTGAGLLHRAGEIAALRALASAEASAGQRLVGPVMQQILEARDDDLVARVTRSWSLPCSMRMIILRWRQEQEESNPGEAVRLLTMSQALATELVHAATCTPDLVDAAREALKLPAEMIDRARADSAAIEALLDCC